MSCAGLGMKLEVSAVKGGGGEELQKAGSRSEG